MREFSKASATFLPEHGIDIARWSQRPAAEALPFQAMWCVVPPGCASRPDQHPEVELAVVVSGRGEFDVAGERLPVEPGAAVLFDPQERHVIHNPATDQPMVVLSLYWLPDGGSGP